MFDCSRRRFLAGAAAIPFALWFEKYAAAQGPLVRCEAYTPDGQAMLAKYAAAVKKMMELPEGDPRNWIFQWYSHAVKRGVTKNEEIARVFTNQADPHRALALEMWSTCQSHFGAPGFKSRYFLPWHRMYVFYFERIVRSLSGDPKFTLPYWNYSTNDQAKHGVIPPEFRKPSDPVYGKLYVEGRNGGANAGVNAGRPIDRGQPANLLGLSALAECEYDPRRGARGFCAEIDGGMRAGIHGFVHGLVGDRFNMGDVPWAAKDPIFWLHHCNIDRLWASWNKGGRRNPTDDDWTKTPFIFADENGNRVVAKAEDFAETEKLGYKYDAYEPVPACPTPPGPLTGAAAAIQTRAAVPTKGIELGDSPVRVTLEPPPASTLLLSAHVRNLRSNRRIYLVVRDIRANTQPGVLYHLFLEAPSGNPPVQVETHHVGTLSFFDAVDPGDHGGHGGAVAPATTPDRPPLTFDVTNLVKNLREDRRLPERPTLTIAPSGAPAADAKPVVGDISLVEQ